MHPGALSALFVNLAGGACVLASYALGFTGNPESVGRLWGGVPKALQPTHTTSMLLATVGYFAFTHFLVLRVEPQRMRIAERWTYSAFVGLYAALLIPSARWMPLTFRMLDAPSNSTWIATRAVLAVVGGASVLLVVALCKVSPREPRWAWRLAVLGAFAFAVQTALLDALVWPAYFPHTG